MAARRLQARENDKEHDAGLSNRLEPVAGHGRRYVPRPPRVRNQPEARTRADSPQSRPAGRILVVISAHRVGRPARSRCRPDFGRLQHPDRRASRGFGSRRRGTGRPGVGCDRCRGPGVAGRCGASVVNPCRTTHSTSVRVSTCRPPATVPTASRSSAEGLYAPPRPLERPYALVASVRASAGSCSSPPTAPAQPRMRIEKIHDLENLWRPERAESELPSSSAPVSAQVSRSRRPGQFCPPRVPLSAKRG